jgi:hypothetical protein
VRGFSSTEVEEVPGGHRGMFERWREMNDEHTEGFFVGVDYFIRYRSDRFGGGGSAWERESDEQRGIS